jgi:hypothetical protein
MILNSVHLKLFAWTCAFLAFATVSECQQPGPSDLGPIPAAIKASKTIFVSNAGADSGLFPEPFSGDPTRPYSEFYADLKAGGQYQLVGDPAEADLVLEIRLSAPLGPANPNKINGASDPLPMLRLVVYDRKSHYILWTITDSVDEALLQKTHDRNLDDAVKAVADAFERMHGDPAAAAPATTQ